MIRPATGRTRTLLMYAQDSRGLGHVTRSLTIARRILCEHPDLVVYIATRSPLTGFTLPERTDYVKLPTRMTPRVVRQSPEERQAAKVRFREIRGRILREAALALAPDLVLVDHEPLGSKGEFRDGLYALKAQRPDTTFVFGLRDIMDDPARIRSAWRKMGVYEALDGIYDGIAVYGVPSLYDVADAYAIPETIRPKLSYCGYVVRELPPADPASVRREHGLPCDGPLVLATVGGGRDGYPVLAATRAAIERLRSSFPDLSAILVTGPFMRDDDRERLRESAPDCCRVLRAPDNGPLLAAADAVVGMGGYNTVCEALATARPLVIVPRATHKVEQRIRAETFAACGLVRWIHPDDLDGPGLVNALEWALRCDRRAHARQIRETIPAFDGASRLTAHLSRWLAGG